ncbi:guanine deaminase-like [Elysia marginata]|uniref:Guanine deaminase-like n=1 Tax=Elysia marginata TaxID=1093978 RepID=A0AAV4GMN9_9GAST|nr:guanine deaminase-like [Elysia marginata]
MNGVMNGVVKKKKDLVVQGCFVHSVGNVSMLVQEEMVMGIQDGRIVFFDNKDKLNALLKSFEMNKENFISLERNQFIVPGFIDSHAHAPQYTFMGSGGDLPLLPWLQKYTFPAETRIDTDKTFSRDVYEKCVRAFIGKVNMDINSPENYIETREESVKATHRFLEDILSRKNPLLTPCITPRFAVSCSNELMVDLAKIAKEKSLPIQTHISENRDEVKMIASMFPEAKNYTDVYDRAGLLNDTTILAHGVYLTDEELQVIAQRGSGISHCPNSNFSLKSGILDVRKVWEAGVKIGLGTDFAGGHSPTMLDAIRRGVTAANVLYFSQQPDHQATVDPITYKDIFKLATLGSAQVLGISDVVGNFEVGKQFDALLIDPDVKHSSLDVFSTDTREDIIQKFLFLGDDRNILKVFVNGSQVV